ncbi:unnamed protein product [Pieris brassicae]|uniref:Uncharacterized protein n=1 Tax=Pieris brassicae TaxID=7116 RepID=A0A9P0SNM2_PIEBR|nr:unnamed protein product [Pieris brassicae]
MYEMSIQELNGKAPKKRKKSLDTVEQEAANVGAEDVKDKPVGVELLHWRDMPKHLQFNPYVLTGYRPLQDWGGCLRSLFYFHNETINILTHGNV